MAHRGQHAVQDYVLQRRPEELEAVLEEPPGAPEPSRPLLVGGMTTRLAAAAGGAATLAGRSGPKIGARGRCVARARSGQLVALSERCLVGLDGGPHYQVRVAPRTDAGLVLCRR